MPTDPEHLAADLERLAKRLRADGRAALSRSADWSGNLSGAATGDGRRGSGVSDPTGRLALARPDQSAQLYAQLRDMLNVATTCCLTLNSLMDRCSVQRVEREDANGLEAENSRAGICEVCGTLKADPHWHTGTGNDRLRKITTGERDEAYIPVTPLACEPCYRDWMRRPYADGMHLLVSWDEWLAGRTMEVGP